VVQIVDARNPLLFRCEDLETYVKEVSPDKLNLILINKADFLTEEQRQAWAEYFTSINVKAVFFSATLAAQTGETETDKTDGEGVSLNKGLSEGISECEEEGEGGGGEEEEEEEEEEGEEEFAQLSQLGHVDTTRRHNEILTDFKTADVRSTEEFLNSAKLLTREELVAVFRSLHVGVKVTAGVTTIGMVGYPNVGKSSTINTLLTYKKVSVSSTPGKTKHFQV
jgi:large subunit GTPase 1